MAIVKELSGNGGIMQGNTAGAPDQHLPEDHDVPLNYSVPVVGSDTVNLPNGVTEYLVVNTAGNLKVTWPNGTTDTLTLPAGIFKLAVLRVWLTGLTAAVSAGY